MGLVYHRTDSGLVLAEHGQDEAAVARALKEHDRDLRLVPQRSDAYGHIYYSVYRYAGSERDAEFVCAWQNESGEPRPLSFGLVDLVKQLDKNTRSRYLSDDERNTRKREREAKQEERDREALISDWQTREGRSAVLPRGAHLRQARSRTGYHERST